MHTHSSKLDTIRVTNVKFCITVTSWYQLMLLKVLRFQDQLEWSKWRFDLGGLVWLVKGSVYARSDGLIAKMSIFEAIPCSPWNADSLFLGLIYVFWQPR